MKYTHWNARDFIKELEKHTSLTYDVEDEDANGDLYVRERKIKTITELLKDIKDIRADALLHNEALSEAIQAVNQKTPIQKVDGDITNSTITGILLLTGEGHTVSENLVKGLVTTYNPKVKL